MSILDHLNPDYRAEEQPARFKSSCCMKYTVDVQCNRCPFKQIEDVEARDRALHECYDKRMGVYEVGELKIEYNNQYR
jgi:hypothetical protein